MHAGPPFIDGTMRRPGQETMYPSADARQLMSLLRIAPDLDIVGDVTVGAADPSQLLAWASVLARPACIAWRAEDSGQHYVNVSAYNDRAPVRGQITAVLHADHHQAFWNELFPDGDLGCGTERALTPAELNAAWEAMPLTPPDASDSP